jgi:hypothetical protein
LERITVGSNIAQTVDDSFLENKQYPSIPVKGRLHPDGAGHRAINELEQLMWTVFSERETEYETSNDICGSQRQFAG